MVRNPVANLAQDGELGLRWLLFLGFLFHTRALWHGAERKPTIFLRPEVVRLWDGCGSNRASGWVARHVLLLNIGKLVVEWDQLKDIQCLGSEFCGRIDSGDVSVKTLVSRLGVCAGLVMNRTQQLQVGLALLEREPVA